MKIQNFRIKAIPNALPLTDNETLGSHLCIDSKHFRLPKCRAAGEVEARLVAMEKKLDSIRDLDRKRNDSVESQQNKERTIAEPKRDSLI